LATLDPECQPPTCRRPIELRSIGWVDSDNDKCEDARQSISGGLSALGGSLLANWWSKKQPNVALSAAESEICSCSVGCQEEMFENSLLEEMLGKEPKPAKLHEDNQGCIFWIKNKQVSQRTKHVDIRVMFVREQFHKNKVTPVFCRSECNHSDGMTKNQPPALFVPHMKVIRTGNLLNSTCQREDVEERSSDDVQFKNQSSPA